LDRMKRDKISSVYTKGIRIFGTL